MGLAEDGLQHQVLLGGEVCKPVQVHVLPLKEGGGPQFLRQAGELVPGVQGAPGGHGLVGPENQAQVPEFLPVQALGLLPDLGQLGPGDAAAFQLVQGGEEAVQELRPPGGHGIDGEVILNGLQRRVHGQQPPPLVQDGVGPAPCLGQDPVFQAGEGEDLPIGPGLVAVFPAEAPLGLKGGLLGHQE